VSYQNYTLFDTVGKSLWHFTTPSEYSIVDLGVNVNVGLAQAVKNLKRSNCEIKRLFTLPIATNLSCTVLSLATSTIYQDEEGKLRLVETFNFFSLPF
jgi:hypothetical protein